jgi:hypothetical protein
MRGTSFEIRLLSSREYRKIFIRSNNIKDVARTVTEKILGEIKILSIEAKGGREDDDERQSSQNP